MGTALSTSIIKPPRPKMPPEPKQEPFLAFVRRWEKKLGTFTDAEQKSDPTASTIEEDQEEDDSELACTTSTASGSQQTQSPKKSRSGIRKAARGSVSGLSCLPRRSSRAATKLKTKAHEISVRLARKRTRRSQPVMEDDFVKHRNCAFQVANLFPDICPQHLQTVASEHGHDAAAVINHIADELEAGRQYPKKTSTTAKRKRDGEDDNEEVREAMARAKRRFDGAGRRAVKKTLPHVEFISKLIKRDFPYAPTRYIQSRLAKNDQLLLPTYLELEETIRNWDKLDEEPWNKNFDSTKLRGINQHQEAELERALQKAKLPQPYREEIEEMIAARAVRSARDKMRARRQDNTMQPQKQLQVGEENGGPAEEFFECQCCFDEQSLENMVHCNGEEAHFFCIGCARRNAEHEVGLARFELKCMATDSCKGGFAHTQRLKFLDTTLSKALDRIETRYNLSLAGLEDLEKCPFCDYAAVYPPVEVNRVFECLDSSCMKRSCRLCHKEDHVPLTCEEFAKENGLSARRTIEEARSEAVIRRCNKCNNPFIKEMGCNKMTCPVISCRNVQCYICSKSCDYQHFSRENGCVLYDNIETRHQGDLQKAEEAARSKILEQNPDMSDEQLKIEMSHNVKTDDDRRRTREPYQDNDNIFWDEWRQAGGRAHGPDAAGVNAMMERYAEIANRARGPNGNHAPHAVPQGNQAAPQDERANAFLQFRERREHNRAAMMQRRNMAYAQAVEARAAVQGRAEQMQNQAGRFQEEVRARLARAGGPAAQRDQEAAAAAAAMPHENNNPQDGPPARTRSQTRRQRENNAPAPDEGHIIPVREEGLRMNLRFRRPQAQGQQPAPARLPQVNWVAQPPPAPRRRDEAPEWANMHLQDAFREVLAPFEERVNQAQAELAQAQAQLPHAQIPPPPGMPLDPPIGQDANFLDLFGPWYHRRPHHLNHPPPPGADPGRGENAPPQPNFWHPPGGIPGGYHWGPGRGAGGAGGF